eukprot:TRINITY_DN1665_c0_g1_i8.p2 TRINITY_DN1665_c0_g1~~TRINITY_DN1665_c0_g1_i8.p2  ORF type:complete len:144 (+),score=28.77 TRINITY_DN1665_c0_g1_i8:1045-1476(+)
MTKSVMEILLNRLDSTTVTFLQKSEAFKFNVKQWYQRRVREEINEILFAMNVGTGRYSFLGFVHSPNLSQMRNAITNKREIRECLFEGYSIFSYFYTKTDTFGNYKDVADEHSLLQYQLLQECRGIVFSADEFFRDAITNFLI